MANGLACPPSYLQGDIFIRGRGYPVDMAIIHHFSRLRGEPVLCLTVWGSLVDEILRSFRHGPRMLRVVHWDHA